MATRDGTCNICKRPLIVLVRSTGAFHACRVCDRMELWPWYDEGGETPVAS